jgi:glucosamine 6-phosphate synthetase-like amidotransferase/phosphosugar isomerase protein
MCGLFGFVSKNKKPVDVRRLKDIAETTMLRGPHAWGMAWVDGKGRLKTFKQTGRIVDELGLLAMARDAQLLIGHCRYATHGDPAVNHNNHPHHAGDAQVVHNGVIHHYRSLVAKHGLRMQTKCDSEVLALLLKKFRGKPINRMTRAAREAMGIFPFAALALWPDRLVATTANGQPLKIGETPDAFWLASLEPGLPGRVSAFPEGEVLEFA